MIYQFKDVETGEPVDVDMPMAKAVDIGAIIRRKGRKLKRLAPNLTTPVIAGDFYTNYQCTPGTSESSGAKNYDEKGRPKFTSRREAREWAKRKTGEGYGTVFDG